MIIDTHCHLSKSDYNNISTIISNMNGNIMIASGVDYLTSKEVLRLCNKYTNVYGTIGFHPTELQNYSDEALFEIEKALKNKKIIGIGEIGLDYHYGKETAKLQKEIFIKQIKLAIKYNLPIVIHSRDAALDTYNILEKYKTKDLKAVMHCYSYSYEMAMRFIKLGVKLGVGGTLTFKNNNKLKEIIENISLDNILLETDSPYLAPEPVRGTKNEPANLKYVVKKIAELKNISEEEVKKITTKNAVLQFDLDL